MMRNIGRIPIALLNVAACAHRPPPPEAQPSAGLEALAEQVTIHRDDYGVPHVHGETDAAAVFGYMYAQAADALGEVEREVAEMTGRLARARRRGGRLVGSLRARVGNGAALARGVRVCLPVLTGHGGGVGRRAEPRRATIGIS